MDTNKYNSDVIEIDLMEVAGLLWHRMWLIIICALITGAAGFVLSKFVVTEQYESITKIYVLNRQNDSTLTYSDVQLGTQLTKDFPELIKSRYVAEQVIAAWELPYSYETLADKISVVTQSDTRIISIIVTDEDPWMAQQLADEVRKVASERIKSVMDIQAVNVVDEANFPEHPASPSVGKWTVIGALIGALLCMAAILLRFMLDDTIKTADDIEKYLGLSTLGMIPEREDPDKSHKGSGHISHFRERTGQEPSRKEGSALADAAMRKSDSQRQVRKAGEGTSVERDASELRMAAENVEDEMDSASMEAVSVGLEGVDLEEIDLEDMGNDDYALEADAEQERISVRPAVAGPSAGRTERATDRNGYKSRRASNVHRISAQGGQMNAVD